MNNLYIRMTVAILLTLVSISCGHSDDTPLPDTSSGEPITLTVDAQIPTSDIDRPIPDGFERRIIFEVYDINRQRISRAIVPTEKPTAQFLLDRTEYAVVAWSDIVRSSDINKDLLFDTSSLVPIKSLSPYTPSLTLKQTLFATTTIKVQNHLISNQQTSSIPLPLQPSWGSYELISTDIEQLRQHLTADSQTLDGYNTRITYSGYLATGFNCLDGIRKDSHAGVTFTTPLSDFLTGNSSTATIASDCIFTLPDNEITIEVRIDLLTPDNIILTTSKCRIPLTRGQHTTLRGRYLTTSSSDGNSGIGIDENYDATIDIDLGIIH